MGTEESLRVIAKLLVTAMAHGNAVVVHYFDGPTTCAIRGWPVVVDREGVRVDTRSGDRSARFVRWDLLFRVDDAAGKPMAVLEGFTAEGEVTT